MGFLLTKYSMMFDFIDIKSAIQLILMHRFECMQIRTFYRIIHLIWSALQIKYCWASEQLEYCTHVFLITFMVLFF